MGFKNEPDEDYEILDMENWSGQKNLIYSNQTLVMKAFSRILELCGHELAEGVNETTFDPIKKTTKVIYKEDTKKAFTNAVKVARALMFRDFDKDAKDEIEGTEEQIEEEKTRLLKLQKDWWESLNAIQRKGFPPVDINFLHSSLVYSKEFVKFEVDAHLYIFQELNNLVKRLRDYQVEDFEA